MQHTAGIEGRLAALTRRGHYDMAPMALSAQQVDDIVAYIESLGALGARSGGDFLARPHDQGSRRAAVFLAAQADGPRDQNEAMALGRALVERNCGGCHGVGRSDRSLHPAAPVFRDLADRYDVEALGESLAEGILTGHPDMPEFRFEAHEIESILLYLQSVQVRQRGKRPQTSLRDAA